MCSVVDQVWWFLHVPLLPPINTPCLHTKHCCFSCFLSAFNIVHWASLHHLPTHWHCRFSCFLPRSRLLIGRRFMPTHRHCRFSRFLPRSCLAQCHSLGIASPSCILCANTPALSLLSFSSDHLIVVRIQVSLMFTTEFIAS